MNRRSESYSYPHVRRPFGEMDRETLASTAIVVEAGVYAEHEMCRSEGEDREIAVLDDRRQIEAVQELGPFTQEEMAAFGAEAASLVRENERAVREVARELDRRNVLSGERVSEIVAKHSGGDSTGGT